MKKNVAMLFKQILLLSFFLNAATVFADPEETLARARDFHQQALALEHGWAVTEPLIEEARAALAAGDTSQAQELASRALLVAEQSLKQAQREKTAWQSRVVGR